jgi:hypothetical protein
VPRDKHPPELTALFAPLDGNSISCLLDHLDPEQIVERLQALERDASSLRLLLRAVRARRRSESRVADAGAHGKGAPHDAA